MGRHTSKANYAPLRRLRRSLEYTLDDLHVATGIDVATLSKVERGLRRPTDGQKAALARFFKRTPDQLFHSEAAA